MMISIFPRFLIHVFHIPFEFFLVETNCIFATVLLYSWVSNDQNFPPSDDDGGDDDGDDDGDDQRNNDASKFLLAVIIIGIS